MGFFEEGQGETKKLIRDTTHEVRKRSSTRYEEEMNIRKRKRTRMKAKTPSGPSLSFSRSRN
jgi:hypothetical protein